MAVTNVGGSCPNCGGALVHKGKGKLVCPFCDGTFYDEHLASMEDDDVDVDTADDDVLDDEEIDEIVRDAVRKYVDPDCYGVQLSLDGESMSKENKARDNFDIDDEDTIYMIYDETMFGSCKNGYAITDFGLYISYPDCGNVFFAWDEFDEVEIEKGDTAAELFVDDCAMDITAGDFCKQTRKMLQEIQDQLFE